jgi:ABC-type phosphate/phosphonate transport system substrate-binding protein
MKTLICATVMLLVTMVSATAQSGRAAVSPDVLKDLTPTGKLRAAINLGNAVLAQPDAATGQPKGITPDIANELGRRLGVPVELVVYQAAGKVFDAVKDDAWDVCFKQPLVAYASDHPEMRVMDGHFMEIQQAMGTPKGRTADAAYLRAFVEEIKASGFVAEAIKRSNQSAAVAPPEPK